MGSPELEVLACPSCLGPLALDSSHTAPSGSSFLLCNREHLRFPIEGGVARLVRPDRMDAVVAFDVSYSMAWTREGWGSSDPAYFLHLPYRDISRLHASEWGVKARSLEALQRLLVRLRPRRIVDLGCGTGWLSYRLAQKGYEVYAIDVVMSELIGLRAAGVYIRAGVRFVLIQGELEFPPLADQSVDAVICNASLHYAHNPQTAFEGIRRILRPGGPFIVMNSPVHNDALSARRSEAEFRKRLIGAGANQSVAATYHHLTRIDLDQIARKAGFEGFQEELFDPGLGFRLSRRAKSLLLRTELASFPILFTRLARA